MSSDLALALIGFAFVTSVTPGPNNIMLMASGANFGFARTLPHLLGVGLGFVIMALVLGAGLAGAIAALPWMQPVLKAAATGYMLWLAWKIARAAPPAPGAAPGRALTFLQAVAFQWVNPKVWAMALTALGGWAPGGEAVAVLTVALVFGAVNLPSVAVWVLAGRALAGWLARPGRLRAFNSVMALLLVASLVPILRG